MATSISKKDIALATNGTNGDHAGTALLEMEPPVTAKQKTAVKRKVGSWSQDEARKEKDAQHLANLITKSSDEVRQIVASKIDVGVLELTIEGDAELICHAWSEKAKKQILDKQMKVATAGGREAKDPEVEYQGSMYLDEHGKPGFPAIGLKKATISVCTSMDDIPKTLMRQAIHVRGDILPVKGELYNRQDMVRIAGNTADIRFRATFKPGWRITFQTVYNRRVMSLEQVINVFNMAGSFVGIGEWRPERDGVKGTFTVIDGLAVEGKSFKLR